MQCIDWDDFRFALAVSRNGSLAAAARALRVDNSTAFRHLNALEARPWREALRAARPAAIARPQPASGCSTRRSGWRPRRSRSTAISSARDTRLSGKLRVTSSETLAFRILTNEIARFRAGPSWHRGRADDRQPCSRSFTPRGRRRASCVAAPRARLFGRKLADIIWAVYGTTEVLGGHPPSTVEEGARRPRRSSVGGRPPKASAPPVAW